jgi:hypothetical protein
LIEKERKKILVRNRQRVIEFSRIFIHFFLQSTREEILNYFNGNQEYDVVFTANATQVQRTEEEKFPLSWRRDCLGNPIFDEIA